MAAFGISSSTQDTRRERQMTGLEKPIRRSTPKLIGLCASTVLLMGLSGPSLAADLRIPLKAPPVQLFSWTGFYLGANIGWGWGNDSTTEYLTGTNTLTGLSWNYKPSGLIGGAYAGANYQIGAVVFGVESDIEATGINGGFHDVLLGGAGDTRVAWQGSFRGRLGFAIDKTLFYGTGGLGLADISHTYKNLSALTTEETSGLRTGWTAGAGVEMAFTEHLLVRAEYRYSDFGKYRFDSVVTFPGLTGEQQPTFNTVRVGAAYKF
jgi:outer membrane immunogenic protein